MSSFGDIEKIRKYNILQLILSIIEEGIINNLKNEQILEEVFSIYHLVKVKKYKEFFKH